VSDLITSAELARMLCLDIRTISRRRAAGTLDIPTINIAPPGGRPQPRFRLADVEDYLSRKCRP
jgi:hypothetical protein